MINLLLPLLILLFSLVGSGTAVASSPETKSTLKILSYNVRNCVGLDRAIDYNRIADIIRRIDADVVAIQELDSATTRSKGVVVLKELATKTYRFATYSASIDFQGGKYGVGILTKEKPVSCQKISLPGREEKRSLLIVELKDYVIGCTHLSLTSEDRLSSIVLIEEATRGYSKPVFLAGDLNAEPGSEALNRLTSNWTMLNNPQEFTFPANEPNKCIDFILARKESEKSLVVIDAVVEAEKIASDHRPVWIKLNVK